MGGAHPGSQERKESRLGARKPSGEGCPSPRVTETLPRAAKGLRHAPEPLGFLPASPESGETRRGSAHDDLVCRLGCSGLRKISASLKMRSGAYPGLLEGPRSGDATSLARRSGRGMPLQSDVGGCDLHVRSEIVELPNVEGTRIAEASVHGASDANGVSPPDRCGESLF